MPSINMIAARRSEKKRLEGNMRRLMVVILAEVFMGLLVGGFLTLKVYSTRARIDDLDVQRARLQPTVDKIGEFDKATAQLGPKLTLLADAKRQTLRWSNLMSKLSEILPNQTWLTKISTETPLPGTQPVDQEGANSVNINGVSIDQNQVGEAMLRLNSYPDFDHVDLHFTQKSTVGTLRTVEFEIAAALKTNDKAKEGAHNDNTKS
jgi:Tfp pilus assembly protein PilN